MLNKKCPVRVSLLLHNYNANETNHFNLENSAQWYPDRSIVRFYHWFLLATCITKPFHIETKDPSIKFPKNLQTQLTPFTSFQTTSDPLKKIYWIIYEFFMLPTPCKSKTNYRNEMENIPSRKKLIMRSWRGVTGVTFEGLISIRHKFGEFFARQNPCFQQQNTPA